MTEGKELVRTENTTYNSLLEYFKGDELAANVWSSKYAAEGETSPIQMHHRMAKEFARVTKFDEAYVFSLFDRFKHIVPQGSIMATLGTDIIASLSNCWVAQSPLDSYASILKTDADLAFYYKRRGGVGTDLSNLRPAGAKTNNTAKTTTGMASFMHRYSNTTREVAMNGRRGALMLSCSINHPDVMDFIKIKRDGTSVTGANISVKLTRKFMVAVEQDKDYILRWPCDANLNKYFYATNKLDSGITFELLPMMDLEYDKLKELCSEDGELFYVKRIKAKEYWDELIKSARDYAEPGLMYWDNMLDYDPAAVYDRYLPTCSNPCGEQFLNPNDSCRLMATNLFSFVNQPFTKNASIDGDMLYKISYDALILGDGLVDLELEYIQRIINKIKSDPEPDNIKQSELDLWEESYKMTKAGRRVGLGITALGDMLAGLGFKYDSDDAFSAVDQVMYFKMKAELNATIDLAEQKGPFEGWNRDAEFVMFQGTLMGKTPFYQFLVDTYPEEALRMYHYGRRNVSWSTIAPTGSVSILTQTTSGCEPLFQPYYMRRKKVNPGEDVRVDFIDETGDSWQEFPVLHPKFKDWIPHYQEYLHINNYDDAIKDYSIEEMTKEDLKQLFEASPWYKSTANDIDWIKRNDMQAILQTYTTNAISSTINLPSTVTYEEVDAIYMDGYRKGLKGQTVYVDGSRSGVLVTENSNVSTDKFGYVDAIKRPECLPCDIHTTVSKGTKWNVIVGLMDNKPYEVFAIPHFTNKDKAELCKIKRGRYDLLIDGKTYSEDITSEMSSEEELVTRLVSTGLRHRTDITYLTEQLNKSEGDITSFGKALARVTKKYIPEGTKSTVSCQDCGSDNVIFEEGCNKCRDCGSSKCG